MEATSQRYKMVTSSKFWGGELEQEGWTPRDDKARLAADRTEGSEEQQPSGLCIRPKQELRHKQEQARQYGRLEEAGASLEKLAPYPITFQSEGSDPDQRAGAGGYLCL